MSGNPSDPYLNLTGPPPKRAAVLAMGMALSGTALGAGLTLSGPEALARPAHPVPAPWTILDGSVGSRDDKDQTPTPETSPKILADGPDAPAPSSDLSVLSDNASRPGPPGAIHRDGSPDMAPQKGLLTSNLPFFEGLSDKGISLSAHLAIAPGFTARRSDPYKNYHSSTAPSQEDLTLELDLGKLAIWKDSKFTFTVINRNGKSLSDRTSGSYSLYQFMYGQGQNFRLSELTLQKAFGPVELRGGFYPMGNEFGRLPYGCVFVANTNCGHPQALPQNTEGWQDGPSGQWGGRVKISFNKTVSLMVGAWGVNHRRTEKHRGWYLGHKGTTGTMIPAELTWAPEFRDKPGTFRLGAYYDTSRASAVGHPEKRRKRGRYGVYLMAGQQIFQRGAYSTSGLGVFGDIVFGDRRTAKFSSYQTIGLDYRGMMNSRPDDSIGFSYTNYRTNRRSHRSADTEGKERQVSQGQFELVYVLQATPWLQIRPAIGYDVRPGGYRSNKNTLFGVAYLQMTL